VIGTDEWLASDDGFSLFLATIKPADFNAWEWDAYQWHRTRRTSA
jgi:hypothetical protein